MQKVKKTPDIRKTSFSRRPWLIILIIIAVAIISLIVAKIIVSSTNSSTSISTNFSTDSVENSTNSTDKKNSSQNTSTENSTKLEPKVVKFDGEDPNNSDSLTGSLTFVGISGNNLSIRVNINQYLASGTCELSLTDGGITHTDSASIVPVASTSTCEGFDVPLRALGAGKYLITINLTSGDKKGTISGEYTI